MVKHAVLFEGDTETMKMQILHTCVCATPVLKMLWQNLKMHKTIAK